MPEPVFSTDFDVRSLHAGQGVLFRVPEYLELELGTVTGPPGRAVKVWRVTGPIGSTCVRALDLTDVLTELEKPRPTDGIPFAPLVGIIKIDRLPGVLRADWCVQTPCSKGISDRAVEAAAICLLGFLDELKKWGR